MATTQELKNLAKIASDRFFSGHCGIAYTEGYEHIQDVVPAYQRLMEGVGLPPIPMEEDEPLAVMYTLHPVKIGILTESGDFAIMDHGIWRTYKIEE